MELSDCSDQTSSRTRTWAFLVQRSAPGVPSLETIRVWGDLTVESSRAGKTYFPRMYLIFKSLHEFSCFTLMETTVECCEAHKNQRKSSTAPDQQGRVSANKERLPGLLDELHNSFPKAGAFGEALACKIVIGPCLHVPNLLPHIPTTHFSVLELGLGKAGQLAPCHNSAPGPTQT
jgi:hypothetical protein